MAEARAGESDGFGCKGPFALRTGWWWRLEKVNPVRGMCGGVPLESDEADYEVEGMA